MTYSIPQIPVPAGLLALVSKLLSVVETDTSHAEHL
jgi:hypothetical protein